MFSFLIALLLNAAEPPYVSADKPPTPTTHYIYDCSTEGELPYAFTLDVDWKNDNLKLDAFDLKMSGDIVFSDFENSSFAFLFTGEKYQILIWLGHNTEYMPYVAYFNFEIYGDLDYSMPREKVGFCKFNNGD